MDLPPDPAKAETAEVTDTSVPVTEPVTAGEDAVVVNDEIAPIEVKREPTTEEDLLQDLPGEGDGQPSSDTTTASPSLADLRQRVLEQRGSRGVLPPGWDDEQPDGAEVQVKVESSSDSVSDSSSDSDSDSDSSSSDDDDTARAAMLSDYDSDEEGGGRGGAREEGGGTTGPTTKNELQHSKANEIFGKVPFDSVPEDLRASITPLGKIHGRVQEVLVIAQHPESIGGSAHGTTSIAGPSSSHHRGHNDRQGPILDAGSLVCLQDGNVIGLIFETFGSLLAPLYSIILPSTSEKTYDLSTPVYFLPSHSTILRPAELRANQGKASDASNVHDEEPNEWEVDQMDFSDDEEEAEFKRRLKEKRRGGKRQGEEGGEVRGKNAKRGKGRGGSTRGGSTQAHTLPARPNWQLDDPAGSGTTALQYEDSTTTDAAVDARSSTLKPYGDVEVNGDANADTPLHKPPPSAGLPRVPVSAGAADASASVSSPSVNTAPMAPPQPAPQQAGPAIHINPLFAHRLFGGQQPQQQQQQAYSYPQQHAQQQQFYQPYGGWQAQQPQQQQQYPGMYGQGPQQYGSYGGYNPQQQQQYGGYPYGYQQQQQPQHQQQWNQQAYGYPPHQGQGQPPNGYDPSQPQ